jgi:hypothetical protein
MEVTSPLILIATVHLDPQGYTRLTRLLSRIAPTLITLEVSPYAIHWREANAARLRQALRQHLGQLLAARGQPTDVETFIAQSEPFLAIDRTLELPFEYTASRDYATAHGVACQPIDISEISEQKLALVEAELLAAENLATLLDLAPTQTGRTLMANYFLARQYRANPHYFDLHYGNEERAEMARRSEAMAGQINAALASLSPARLVHVCGWEHVIRHERIETIIGRLSDYQPQVILLDEADRD